MLVGGGDHLSPRNPFFISCFILDDSLRDFRLLQWNPAPAPAASQAVADDSSGSSNRSSGPDWEYTDRDARRFLEERNATRRELEVISKQAGIADLEWQHQRKQLLEAIDGKFCNSLNLQCNPLNQY